MSLSVRNLLTCLPIACAIPALPAGTPFYVMPASTIPNTGCDVLLNVDRVVVGNETCERKDGSILVLHVAPTDAGFSFAWIDDATGQVVGNGLSLSGLAAGSYDLQATDATGCQQKVATIPIIDQ